MSGNPTVTAGQRMCPICGKLFEPGIAFCAVDGAKLMAPAEAGSILADDDPLVRTLVGGRYRILKRIGEGGMGMVYLAEHEAIEKKVAVKVLKEQYATREDVVARFQQEAKSASRVKHEGVLEVFDFGRTEDGRFFLAMEMLDGTDLAHVLEAEHNLDPARAARFGIKLARALKAAHEKGVIHRDMKPENIFVRVADDGREVIKIVDFGIAQLRAEGEDSADPNAKVSGRKLTKTGMIFGTPDYMSPEQAAGKSIDQRVDVYALGVILFEMLTGTTPFSGETFMAILTAHLIEPIPRMRERAPSGFNCSAELEAVVDKALAKSPEDRFRDMAELADALLATPEGVTAEGLRAPMRMSNFPARAAGVVIAPTDVRMRTPVPALPSDARAATMMQESPPVRTTVASVDGATVSAPPPKKSSNTALIAIAIAAVLGVGGFLGLRAREQAANDVPATNGPSVPEPKIVPTIAPSVIAPASAAPSSVPSDVSAPAKTTKIHVETTPTGAVVEKEVGKEWLQVCDTSPCDVIVDTGSAVYLRASKSGLTAERKLLADHEQKLAFTLAGGGGGSVAPKASTGKQDLCEVELDEGIKVWRPCKH